MPTPLLVAAVLGVAFFAGAVPFSFLVARAVSDVDLREVGTGTVSGTSLYRVAGFGPLAVGGLLDVGKGAVGPALAVLLVGDHAVLEGVAAGLAVAGHNWSPFLRGAGGRGISPGMGALAVVAWPGSLVLLAGLAFGRIAGETGFGSFVAQAALLPILGVLRGTDGLWIAVCVVLALWVKRMLGNEPPARDGRLRTLVGRLLVDRDDLFREDEGQPGDHQDR